MYLPDYHMHTYFSPDSKAQHLDMVQAAAQRGITNLCFTDHMDLGHPEVIFDRIPDFDGMRLAVAQTQAQMPDMRIRCGLEAGYLPEFAQKTAEVVASQQLDYVIHSVHVVDGQDCWVPGSMRGKSKETAYRMYLEAILRSVTDPNVNGCYDCIGHIGYICKCCHYEDNTLDYPMFPSLLDDILSAVIQAGKGIEVNTSGLRKNGHVLAHPSIIQRYRELGGKIITIGSDAHAPDRAGEDISVAAAQIKAAGFTEFTVFENRTPIFIPIGE